MTDSIAVCIITCKRPEGLGKLLQSLSALTFTKEATPEIRVIVVDNDPAGSAKAITDAASLPFPLDYAVEKERGIPFARNRCLEMAVENNTNLIAFLDDDEYCDPAWLDEMLHAYRTMGAEVIQGPVNPVYAVPIPEWMEQSGLFARVHHPNGHPMLSAATNNVLFSAKLVTEGGLRFNTAMRHTGGTDHVFFCQARQKGCKIAWAEHAVVWEDMPANRLSVEWLCRRYLRQGNTHTLTELILHPGLATRLKLAAQGLARVALACAAYPLLPFIGKPNGMKVKKALYRGSGMLSALFHWNYQEYK